MLILLILMMLFMCFHVYVCLYTGMYICVCIYVCSFMFYGSFCSLCCCLLLLFVVVVVVFVVFVELLYRQEHKEDSGVGLSSARTLRPRSCMGKVRRWTQTSP